jgi:hypothetical protein
MPNGVCSNCGNPLKIIQGGQKSLEGSTDITMVHVFGCINKDCKMANPKMLEQDRKETIVPSFNG